MGDNTNLFSKIIQGQEKEVYSIENVVLNLVLPISMAGSVDYHAKMNDKEEQSMKEYSRHLKMNLEILTGSSAEGLGLPEVTEVTSMEQWTSGPDHDIKYVFTSLVVDNHYKKAFARMETKYSRPGFTQLIFNKNWMIHRQSHQSRFIEQEERKLLKYPLDFIDERRFILRKKLTSILRKAIKEHIHSTEKENFLINSPAKGVKSVHFSQHGPAVTVDLLDHTSHVRLSKDYVVALPCLRWPEQASEWVTRQRMWPSDRQVKKITQGGCHIVPKRHHSSNDPTEFILSFSVTEKQVAMCLSIFQKRAYMLLKFLFKFHLNKANRGLTSYHLKTTFFRLCEKTPVEQWTETNPYESLQWLLHDFEQYLMTGVLPHYFISDSNLIDNMTKSVTTVIVQDIKAVKSTCWQVILQLTEKRRFCWLSKDISLPKILQPMLSSSNEALLQATIHDTVMMFVSNLLLKGEIYVAISMICGTTNCEVLPTTQQMIVCTEAALACNNLPEEAVLNITGLLAVLYHQYSKEMKEQKHMLSHSEYLKKSYNLFKDITEKVHHEIWVIAEYYNLLSVLQRHEDLIRHFITNLHHSKAFTDLYTGGVYTRVEGHNDLTTDETFLAIGQMNEFVVPSTAYIFYKVYKSIKCLSGLCKGRQLLHLLKLADIVLKDFKMWSKEKTTKYNEFCNEHIVLLLGLCSKLGGEDKMAEKFFQRAIDYNGTYMLNPDQVLNYEMPINRIKHMSADNIRSHPYLNSNLAQHHQAKSLPSNIFKYKRRHIVLNEFVHG